MSKDGCPCRLAVVSKCKTLMFWAQVVFETPMRWPQRLPSAWLSEKITEEVVEPRTPFLKQKRKSSSARIWLLLIWHVYLGFYSIVGVVATCLPPARHSTLWPILFRTILLRPQPGTNWQPCKRTESSQRVKKNSCTGVHNTAAFKQEATYNL